MATVVAPQRRGGLSDGWCISIRWKAAGGVRDHLRHWLDEELLSHSKEHIRI
jgi:hypothetical protein